MTLSVHNAIASRISIDRFIPDIPVDDSTIAELIRMATLAPSAYNMQNWRFIAVRSQEGKALLKTAAYGQQKITDASVAFIVCGLLNAHQPLATFLQPSVEENIMAQHTADAWVKQATASHENDATLQRDEAVRSASLAAMTLMLAAEGMNLGSCPMVGFDEQQVSRDFALAEHELPLMIVVVGRAIESNKPQKIRRPIETVLSFA